jgi:alpha-N-arabinofuranosidase
MASPALFLRHTSASSWDNAFINFDNRTWFAAPNYVVMKLWHEHYAPLRIQVTGDSGPLNGVATKSKDGAKLYYKVVNPGREPVPVELIVKSTLPIASAEMQLVTADSLNARNTLDNPNRIHSVPAQVNAEGESISFTLPAYSAGVVSIDREPTLY